MDQEDTRRRPDPTDTGVTVTRSGNATAASGGTAVTGYRGPAPEPGRAAAAHLSDTGDAYATGGSIANAGYMSIGTLAVQQHAPRKPAPWPHQVGVIPPAARSFQPRAEADRLRAGIDGGGTAVLNQLLTGMGGVGKTQLAADYARTAWGAPSPAGGLDILVWITASSRQAIVSGYAQAGVELCRGDPNDPERAAETFLAWLTPKAAAKPCRWLIVLDDVADPADLRGLWPPTGPHGRTLITTRRRDAALTADGRRVIDVGLFTREEALSHLTGALAAGGRHDDAEDLAALAEDLGRLPLALAQAAAYLIDTGEDVPAYRALLADRATTLGTLAPDALPDDQALPLAAAWSLSIDRADTLRPAGLARPMLHLVSLLDPNGIPHTVLTSDPALAYLAEHRTLAKPDATEQPAPVRTDDAVPSKDAVRALRALHRLSLIDYNADTPYQAVRVHQLIQRATSDTLSPDRHHQTARAAADALIAAWPDIERDTDLAQTLRTNTAALAASAEDALYRPDAHVVLYRSGTSLGETGQVTAARDHFQRLTDTATAHLGPDHPDTFAARANLAWWRGEAGDPAAAATATADLLTDQLRVLGPDHPDTLTTRATLARWRGEAGDPAAAATATADLLTDQLRVLGPDHPHTLTTRANLAHWRGEAGDPTAAATATAELLDHMVQVVSKDHALIRLFQQNLTYWQNAAEADGQGKGDSGTRTT